MRSASTTGTNSHKIVAVYEHKLNWAEADPEVKTTLSETGEPELVLTVPLDGNPDSHWKRELEQEILRRETEGEGSPWEIDLWGDSSIRIMGLSDIDQTDALRETLDELIATINARTEHTRAGGDESNRDQAEKSDALQRQADAMRERLHGHADDS